MQTAGKLTDRLNFSRPVDWVPVAEFSQVAVSAFVPDTSAVTIQLRKATDAAGTDAADHGAVVNGSNGAAKADVSANELGRTVGGVPYTHVSATITGTDSFGVLMRGGGRFNPSA